MNFQEFASKLRETQAGMKEVLDEAEVVEAAKIVEESVALASGPYRGHKIVATRSIPIPGSNPRVQVKMVSRKAPLLDRNTRPHSIYARKKQALAFSEGGFAAHVNHPGTTGKRMWEKGVALAIPEVQRLATARFAGVLGRVFR